MLKITLAAGLMLSPAILLAEQTGQAGSPNTMPADQSTMSGMSGPSTGHSTMHHHSGHRHTARDASLSRDTQGTENTSNSKSSALNPMPH